MGITIKDVAKQAGVSFATVSRALSGSSEINEATRDKICKIARDMGYTPNSLARSMVRKKTDTIGLIVAGTDNPFMGELTSYIEKRAREKGYTLMVCNSMYDTEVERKTVETLIQKQTDGIIMLPAGNDTYEVLQNYLDRIPVVFLSESLRDRNVHYASVDNYIGTCIGTEYLYSLGHRKVSYVGCRHGSVTHELRIEGFTDTCRKLGMEGNLVYSSFKRSNRQAGYLLGKHIFEKKTEETALFCASDSLAFGVMQAADEAGIRIPEDISVLGFDNITLSELPRIELTTVAQPMQELSYAAVDMLCGVIDGKQNGNKKVLTPVLVERKTCKMIDAEEKNVQI